MCIWHLAHVSGKASELGAYNMFSYSASSCLITEMILWSYQKRSLKDGAFPQVSLRSK